MTSKREQLLNEIEASMNVANMWWEMWQASNETDMDAYKYWMQDEYKTKGLRDAYKIVYGEHLWNGLDAVRYERSRIKA